MRVRLLTTAIFADLSGYFLGNLSYATPCRPVIDCKMSDLQ